MTDADINLHVIVHFGGDFPNKLASGSSDLVFWHILDARIGGACFSRGGSCSDLVAPVLDLICACAQAACCIVSHQSNEEFDAYVLSESSLFVYPERLVLKTCGTTALLAAVPLLLEFAASLNMRCSRFKYSRASFLFPEKQVTTLSSQAAVGHTAFVPPLLYENV